MNDEVDEVLRQLLKSINKRVKHERTWPVIQAVKIVTDSIQEVLRDRKWERDGNPREVATYEPR